MKENITLLKPKIDVVFHSLFRVGNEEITKAIIKAVTKEKIQNINLNNDRHIIGKYPNKEEVSRIMSENKEIKKAMNELQEMSEDEELRRLAELKEKAIRDEKSAKYRWTEEGIKQGIEQGIEKVAKRMIELNIEIQDIIKFTGLTEEQILKLIKELKIR